MHDAIAPAPIAAGSGAASGARSQPAPPARPAAPRRRTAADMIAEELRRRIVAVVLEPGAPLAEKTLTETYGVSRTPVREALIRLAEEGLVDIFPQAGTFVARIPHGSLDEAVVLRKALEQAALSHLAARIDAEMLDRLDHAIGRQRAFAGIPDAEAFHAADEAFHALIAELAGYPGLWRVAQQAKLQIDRCRRLTLPVAGRMNTVITEHQAIVDALRRGEPAHAAAALDMHLTAVLPDADALRARHPHFFR
jgi:GntR family transcriptional regulator, rspAB operon transcriptional repressor